MIIMMLVFTGEISLMLYTEVGVNYVIIGKAPMPNITKTDETVNAKIKSAFHHTI